MIKLIVAHDKNRGIGFKKTIPWFVPGELKWVAETTKKTMDVSKQNALIMGHNTWLSLPEARRPLPGRLNIVISRTASIEQDNVKVCRSLDEAIAYARQEDDIESGFIFGGASIYEQAIDNPLLDELLITVVPGEYPADTYFPALPAGRFTLTDESRMTYGDIEVVRQTLIQ